METSATIVLDRKFTKNNWAKRLWRSQGSPDDYSAALRKWGVSVPHPNKINEEALYGILSEHSPRMAYQEICRAGLAVEFDGFSPTVLFPSRRFPLLRAAISSTFQRSFRTIDLGETLHRVIDRSIHLDLKEICETDKGKIHVELFLRAPFYLAGITLMNLLALPRLISESDYLLSSRHFDFFEWSPLIFDALAGFGLWALRDISSRAKKLEPYEYLPVPPLGYLTGRLIKDVSQAVFLSAILGAYAIFSLPYGIATRYLAYRRLEKSEVIAQNTKMLTEELKDPVLQKALIERWATRGRADLAQIFFDPSYENFLFLSKILEPSITIFLLDHNKALSSLCRRE